MIARAISSREFISVDDYLCFDRSAQWKYEYFAGEVWPKGQPSRKVEKSELQSFLDSKAAEPIGGENFAHVVITGNLTGELHSQLRGTKWQALFGLRFHLREAGLFCYPDLVVFQKPIETEADDIMLNPTVIFEVLSPSTANYDRGDKWAHYQRVASLQQYVLVSQDKQQIEVFTRQDGGAWLLRTATAGEVELASIACRLSVAEVYEGVEFDENAPSQAPF